MGFDISGLKPKNEVGEYFRNNCWWWRPLWDYTAIVCKFTQSEYSKGLSNDGFRISGRKSEQIARILKTEIENGRTKKYEQEYSEKLKKLPMVKCDLCKGTGKRDDEIIKGKCNACDGLGKQKHWETHYPFNEKNVDEFADFCKNSGGFEIY